MIVEFIKRNNLILIFTAIGLVMVVLLLLQIDKQYYQIDKRTIIQGNPEKYINHPIGEEALTRLMQLAYDVLRSPNKSRMEQLREQAGRILEGDNIAWRIVIRKATPREPGEAASEDAGEADLELLSMARPDKLRRYNTLSNSLFYKNFSSSVSQPIQDENTRELYGTLVLFFTSPLDSAKIRELTTLYRWYCLFIVAVAGILAFAAARRVLFPIRNVTSAIEGSSAARTLFIDRPHSAMETLYNRMALDAVIARLQGQMRETIARRPQMTGWEVVQFVSRAYCEQLGPALAACLEMVAEGPGHLRGTGQSYLFTREGPGAAEGELLARLDGLMPRDGRTTETFTLNDFKPPVAGTLELVQDPERTGIRYLFALGLEARPQEQAALTAAAMVERLADLVETGLQTLSLRNQILVQERGRANISLSRNLGHDLTNIIATSKLDLMALDRLLGDGRPPEDPRRRGLLLESLHGLLRSVRFMQETVNLYRSYAFLQHPMLETHDGNALVRDTMELFSMSISAKVDLRHELAEEAPRCLVDPRLIKLALFNLFANALEAIRKADPDHTSRGWIRVRTGRSETGGLTIAIEDSGTGIMSAAGQRAESHEIEKIFELGYTSRRAGGGQGEGLGLNWVRTIVQDLHGGTITAENAEGGGARFVITFPELGEGAWSK